MLPLEVFFYLNTTNIGGKEHSNLHFSGVVPVAWHTETESERANSCKFGREI
jgi:hypothetical protein